MARTFQIAGGRKAAAGWCQWAVVVLLALVLAGCDFGLFFVEDNGECDKVTDNCEDAKDENENSQVAGLNIAFSRRDIQTTYSFLRNRIVARDETRVVVQVDYQQRAAAIGKQVKATSLILFAAPGLAVPLIQANTLAGLSLPLAMTVLEDVNNEVAVAFNDPAYLRERYALGDRDETLAALGELLNLLAQRATADSVSVTGGAVSIGREGIVINPSNADFSTTVAQLNTALRQQPGLDRVAVFNHQANAARVGSNVNPARLFLFVVAEPAVALIRAQQTVAANLPMRMLVYQSDDGTVRVAYNDPAWLAERHGIDPDIDVVADLTRLLEDLADAATDRVPM